MLGYSPNEFKLYRWDQTTTDKFILSPPVRIYLSLLYIIPNRFFGRFQRFNAGSEPVVE